MSLPFWEEKCWGRVLHCFANDHAAVSYLEVEAGNQCSRHYHEQRANTFIVVSGELLLEYWLEESPGYTVSYEAFLAPSDSYTVPSGVLHRFQVVKSGQVIEVYHPDKGGKVLLDDIVRLDVGGPIRD